MACSSVTTTDIRFPDQELNFQGAFQIPFPTPLLPVSGIGPPLPLLLKRDLAVIGTIITDHPPVDQEQSHPLERTFPKIVETNNLVFPYKCKITYICTLFDTYLEGGREGAR